MSMEGSYYSLQADLYSSPSRPYLHREEEGDRLHAKKEEEEVKGKKKSRKWLYITDKNGGKITGEKGDVRIKANEGYRFLFNTTVAPNKKIWTQVSYLDEHGEEKEIFIKKKEISKLFPGITPDRLSGFKSSKELGECIATEACKRKVNNELSKGKTEKSSKSSSTKTNSANNNSNRINNFDPNSNHLAVTSYSSPTVLTTSPWNRSEEIHSMIKKTRTLQDMLTKGKLTIGDINTIVKHKHKYKRVPTPRDNDPSGAPFLIVHLRNLGAGVFKKVDLIYLIEYGKVVASLKTNITGFEAEEKKQMAEREGGFLHLSKNVPNVVKTWRITYYHDSEKKAYYQDIWQSLCNGGELFEIISNNMREEKPLHPRLQVQFSRDIVQALADIHERGIVHRDIKLENILIKKTEKNDVGWRAYLSDFGLSANKTDIERLAKAAGSPAYQPPEIIEGVYVKGEKPLQSTANDVWGAGMCLYMMKMNETPPHYHYMTPRDDEGIPSPNGTIHPEKAMEAIKAWRLNYPEPVNKESFEYVIWRMLDPDPMTRISSAEAAAILNKVAEKEKLTDARRKAPSVQKETVPGIRMSRSA